MDWLAFFFAGLFYFKGYYQSGSIYIVLGIIQYSILVSLLIVVSIHKPTKQIFIWALLIFIFYGLKYKVFSGFFQDSETAGYALIGIINLIIIGIILIGIGLLIRPIFHKIKSKKKK